MIPPHAATPLYFLPEELHLQLILGKKIKANHMKTELLILSHQLSLLQFFTKTAVYVVTLGQQAAWILKK